MAHFNHGSHDGSLSGFPYYDMTTLSCIPYPSASRALLSSCVLSLGNHRHYTVSTLTVLFVSVFRWDRGLSLDVKSQNVYIKFAHVAFLE